MTTTFIHELEDLTDVLDTILPNEDDDLIFNDDICAVEFIETALHLMDIYIEENPAAISEPDFEETFKETIEELMYIQFEEHIHLNDDTEDDLADILDDAFNIFFSTLCQQREDDNNQSVFPDTNEYDNDNDNNYQEQCDVLEKKIQLLRSKPQPVQRTKEWYEFRHNLITASNAYKAFESQSAQNQLIYEKCQPLKTAENENSKPASVNVNTTFHWGQKYEPLSVMMYEYLYNTTIEDFGCIQHEKYHFLGASPDGINVDPNNTKLFGRMLEIKNIVNREITGIPKKEYWIQTQLQMEVCDLDECDFLETKFIEYEDFNAFNEDVLAEGQYKGVIMFFVTQDGRPIYEYKPIHLTEYEAIIEWEETTMDQGELRNLTWIKNCYWKMEKLSCVLITRNRKWFHDNINGIANIWATIEKERVTGYDHRAPMRRIKRETNSQKSNNSTMDNFLQGSCFIDVVKLKGENEVKETCD